jgi:hypothetical protein
VKTATKTGRIILSLFLMATGVLLAFLAAVTFGLGIWLEPQHD